ncbi:MAG: hypothetical protein H6667_04005 [Ardenticatenaceae bacterium]|nr:hypothetical protein [Ardenticatenaceae bacterium]MCB9446108.1 hypothetical protein [Ardenticatenaceae bacterium]
MNQNIDEMMQRTYRYYYEDGLVETAVGILFFVIGLALLGWLTIQSSPALGIVMVILSVLLILGGTLFVQKIIPSLKERFVHPRTGKVVYRQEKPQKETGRWLLYAVLAVLVVTLFLPERFNQMALMEGALLGAIFIYLGHRVSLSRFYWLGGAAILVGVAAVLLFNNDISGSAFTFGSTGLVLLVSGLIVLTRYLRRNPQIEVEDE